MSSLGGKYRIGAKIGGGGMAEVFDGAVVGIEGFSRPVAIKRIHASFSRDPKFGDMFVNEARIASLLNHANVCAVLDFDRDGEGRYFLVMELVDGVDLHSLAARGPVPPAVTVHVVAEVLKGLDYAHELVHEGRPLHIVHRDVSPHNVMLSWQGAVKLVDFGIAKAVAATNASQSGALKGKVSYMSPEQAQGRPLDGRSDEFAAGVVLHELLTGNRLFSGGSEPEVLSRVISQPIPHPNELAPGAPADMAAVCMRMLERDPARRYPRALDALDALLRCQNASARGALELRDLLATRFPERTSGRRSDSQPAFARTILADGSSSMATGTAPPPPAALGATATAPQSPAAVRGLAQTETAPGTSGVSGVAATVMAPAAGASSPALEPPIVTGTGLGYAATVTDTGVASAPATRRSGAKTALIIAVVLVVCGGAVGTALWLKSRGARTRSTTPAAAADAGTPEPSTEDREPSTEDRAPRTEDRAPSTEHRAPRTDDREPRTERRATRTENRATRTEDRGPRTDDREPSSDEPAGFVWVRVQPWAQVTVDGHDKGTTPVKLRLRPGQHKIVITNSETGKTERLRVDVDSGRTKKIARDWR